jgi:hypothetical protein
MLEDAQTVPEAEPFIEMVKEMHRLYELKLLLNYLDRFDDIMGHESLNV